MLCLQNTAVVMLLVLVQDGKPISAQRHSRLWAEVTGLNVSVQKQFPANIKLGIMEERSRLLSDILVIGYVEDIFFSRLEHYRLKALTYILVQVKADHLNEN